MLECLVWLGCWLIVAVFACCFGYFVVYCALCLGVGGGTWLFVFGWWCLVVWLAIRACFCLIWVVAVLVVG